MTLPTLWSIAVPAMLFLATAYPGWELSLPGRDALALTYAACVVVAVGLRRRLAASSVVLGAVTGGLFILPAVVLATGGTESDLYVALAVLPLVTAVLMPHRSELILTSVLGGLYWTIFTARISNAAAGDTAFDVVVVVIAGAVGIYGARTLVASQRAHLQAMLERTSALEAATEASRREASAHQLAALGQIASGVAHELNNPMCYVAKNLEFITAELPGDVDVELRDALRDAVMGIGVMRQIVDDLKGVSRHDSALLPLQVGPLLLAVSRMAAPTVKTHARLVVELGQLPPVAGNAGRLAQVFLNLLVNAAQSIVGSVGANEVRLVATSEPERVIIEVHDTGGGISAEVREKLFTPFFTTKPLGVGTGLGLSVCSDIIAHHGGRISVESVVGRGSVFRVVLPSLTNEPSLTT